MPKTTTKKVKKLTQKNLIETIATVGDVSKTNATKILNVFTSHWKKEAAALVGVLDAGKVTVAKTAKKTAKRVSKKTARRTKNTTVTTA